MKPTPLRPAFRRSRAALVALALGVGAGCGGGSGGSSPPPAPGLPLGSVAPAFALPDVNPASGTFATDVAPSQYVGSASAWYFGHAT